jgi:hypothetical protein
MGERASVGRARSGRSFRCSRNAGVSSGQNGRWHVVQPSSVVQCVKTAAFTTRHRLHLPKKVSLEALTTAVEPNTVATANLVGKFTKIRTG